MIAASQRPSHTRSIRWQLPLSYAAISLLSTLALGLVLLLTLRDYYLQRELEYLTDNAESINHAAADMLTQNTPLAVMEAQLASYAFLAQVRLRLHSADGQVLTDSGIPNHRSMLSISAQPGPAIEGGQLVQNTVLSALDPYVDLQDYPTRIDMAIGIPVEDVATGRQTTRYYMPVIMLEQMYTDGSSDAELNTLQSARSIAAPRPAESDFTRMLAATGTLSGFNLNGEGRDAASRSDQIVRQTIYDDAGHAIGTIELSQGPAYGRQIVNRVAHAWIFASLLAVVVAAAAGWNISQRITVPLLALTETTTRMAGGDLSVRADLRRMDELGQLAGAFNEMARRIEETVVTLRRFVADAAHELHTPLTALHTNLELALDEPTQKTRQVYLERARSQVKRLQSLTDSLLSLSRMESGAANDPQSDIVLCQLVQEVSELYASRAEQAGINFVLALPDQPQQVHGSAGQLRNALGNLLDNAIKFSAEGTTISVRVSAPPQAVQITIQDGGIGIPPDELPYVFGRFHRGRNATNYPGSGLGLAIVRCVIEAHHGTIHIANTHPGLCVTLTLPAQNALQTA